MEGVIIWKILASIIGPAIFWIGYFYYKDRRQPEPLINLLEAFLMGFLAGVACFIAYQLLPLLGLPQGFNLVVAKGQAREIFFYSLGVVGPLEELFKFLPFALFILRWRDLDEPADGVVYAASVAIGFASFENFGYLPMMTGLAFFGRAVASPLTHAIFSSVWGFFVALARMKDQSIFLASLFSLPLAAVFHGLFNVLTVSDNLRILSAVLVLLLWLLIIYLLERQKQAA